MTCVEFNLPDNHKIADKITLKEKKIEFLPKQDVERKLIISVTGKFMQMHKAIKFENMYKYIPNSNVE